MDWLKGYFDVSNLHILAALIVGLALFVAALNFWYVLFGEYRSLRYYLALKAVIALSFAVVYAGDILGWIDPANPATIGRSGVMILFALLCTDIFLRQSDLTDAESLMRAFRKLGGHHRGD